jgi:hypothetical protein
MSLLVTSLGATRMAVLFISHREQARLVVAERCSWKVLLPVSKAPLAVLPSNQVLRQMATAGPSASPLVVLQKKAVKQVPFGFQSETA